MSHKNSSDMIREDGEEAFSSSSQSAQEGYQDKHTKKMQKANHEKINEVLASGGAKVKKHHGRRNLIIVLCLVLVLAILGVTAGFMFTGSPENIVDLGYATVRYDVPTDGSTPKDHTGVENIGYMNDKLHTQPYYYAQMHGTVNTIMTQEIWTYKQYYNGVLISSDITESSMINSAVQFCTTDDWVVWRNSAGGKSTFDGLDTPYTDGDPIGSCSISDFKVLRGLPPSDFSVYVLNENTIDDWSDVIDNGDGTYTQTFYLHVDAEPTENSAVYYYKQQMVATGGLTDFPTFTSAQITYTFDDEWQVLKAEVSEAYKATMGVSVNCTASSTTEYTYGDISLCENTAYEDYFSKYVNTTVMTEDEITPTECLAQAFGAVLTDPVTFSLDMDIDGRTMSGLLYLDINAMDIRADLGNIRLYIEEPDEDSMWLYLSYGDDTKVKLDINSLDLSAFSSSGSDEEDGGSSGGLSLDTDQLLADLSGGEFTVSEDGSVATLNSVIDLFGLSIPVDFVFNIDESGVITLGDVSTNLSLLGMDLDISIKFSDTDVPALTSAEKDAYMDIDDNADSLINLIATFTSNEQEFFLEYGTDSFDLTVSLSLDLAKSLAKGEVDIWFGSGTHKFIGIDYKDGNLYLTLDSADMQPLKVKANLDEAIDLISSFLSSDTDEYAIATVADDDTTSSTDLTSILASLNIDLGDIVYRLLADNDFANTFHITEDGRFEIDATELLAIFDVDLDLGTIYLVADETGIFVDDGPFEFTLTQGEEFTVDDTYFVDAEDLVTLIEELETLIENKSVGLTGAVDVVIGEGEDAATIEVRIDNLTIDWKDGVNVYLQLSFDLAESTQNIYVLYTGSTNTLQLAYGNVGLELSFDTGEGTDLDKMEKALVAAYDQIAEIANYYLAEGKEWKDDAESLQELLEGFGVAIEATESTEDLIEEIIALIPGGDGDFSIMSLLGDMSFGAGSNNGFEVKIYGLDLEILDVSKDHNDQFTMDINLAYQGDTFEVDLQDWEVSAGALKSLPETVQFVRADDIAVLLNSITSAAEILTGTTEIYITYETSSMEISADILFNLQTSNASGLITATFSTTDDTNALYVGFSYEDGMFYLSLYSESNEPFRVKANVNDAVTLISSYFTGSTENGEEEETEDITGTILSLLASVVSSETFSSIVTDLFGNGAFFDIFSNNGTNAFTVDITEICGLFGVDTELLGGMTFTLGNGHITVDLDDAYGVYMDIRATDSSVDARSGEYTDAEDLLELINNITPIIEDAAISLTGEIDLNISGTTIYLDIKESRIDWNDGISVYVKAALGIGEVDQDIYINYVGSTKTLQFAYGDVGVDLSFSSTSTDVATLEDALVDVYNRVVGVINSFAETGIETVDTWDDLLSLLGTGADLTELLSSLFSSGESSDITTEDIMAMIASATLGVGDNGGLAIGIGDYLTLEIADITKTNDGKFALVVNLGYSSETLSLTLDSLTLTAADTYEMPKIDYLGADDFASMLDFVASGLEVLGEKSLTLTISGTQYDYTSEYKSYNNVKYNFTGTLALEWGEESLYPVTKDENGTYYLDPDMYLYLGLNMTALNSADTSYTMSLYLLDRNYDGTTDGELDLYLLISQKATTDKNYDPLMVYIPAKDVMSLVSMVGALCDLDSLTSENSTIQSLLTTVAEFIDSALIETYIPDTQDQFRSLGSSLMGQFIDGGLQGLIDSLLDTVDDVVDSVTGGGSDIVAAENRTNKDAYIKSITVSGTEFSLVVNSESVYGKTADTDLTFTATKTEEDGFTGMSIKNVYYNDMSDMLDMTMTIEHSVTRETSFTGYTNFSGIDTLLQTLVNSATHEVTSTDGELENDGEATEEEYEEAVREYGLNSNYFISGVKKSNTDNGLKLKLYLGFTITLETISIDGISVNIDENNKISLDAQISYSSFSFIWTLIENTATVNLSIRNDMIYMRRTVSGESEYRIMSLSDFSSDIMNQIIWIFSFSDTIADLMTGSSGGSSTDMSSYDYGKLVDAYLSSYTYTESDTSASWEFVINGDTIGDLAGISMTDITVTLSGSKDTDDSSYILNSLLLSGRLYSLIEFDLYLTYDNPQDTGSMASNLETLYESDIYDNLTWDDILGGTTYDEICENINWDRMLSDLGTTCLDYTGSGDLRVGLAEYYFSDGTDSTSLGGSQYVLYNATEQTIYTTLTYPDVSVYDQEENNLKAVWTSYVYDTTNNIITITATRETTYTVTVNGTDINDSESSYDIENVYASTNLAKDTLVLAEDGYYYRLKSYTDAEGNDLDLDVGVDDDGNACYVLPVTGNITIKAVWEQVYGVTFYDEEEGTEVTEYYYAGTVLTADNMPAVPTRTGYTVTWNTAQDGTGESSITVAADGNSPFYAVYTINTYVLTFASDIEVSSNTLTFTFNEDSGYYECTISLVYGTEFELANITLNSSLVTVNGWTYNGVSYEQGSTVRVASDMTIYVDYSYKTVSVHYYYDTDYLYATGILGIDGDYELVVPTLNTDAYILLGWLYSNSGSWEVITSVEDFAAKDVSSVNVYALLAEIPVITIDSASRTSYLVTQQYKASVSISGDFEIVGVLADTGTLSISSAVFTYYRSDDYDSTDNASSLKSYTYSDIPSSISSLSTTASKSSYLLVQLSITFTYEDASDGIYLDSTTIYTPIVYYAF